jgi:hypothetical protein
LCLFLSRLLLVLRRFLDFFLCLLEGSDFLSVFCFLLLPLLRCRRRLSFRFRPAPSLLRLLLLPPSLLLLPLLLLLRLLLL